MASTNRCCLLRPPDPYAHFGWDYQDLVGSNPTWNCSIAHVSYRYDIFTGGRLTRLARLLQLPCAVLFCPGSSNRCSAAAGEEGNYVQQQMWQNYMRSVEVNNK